MKPNLSRKAGRKKKKTSMNDHANKETDSDEDLNTTSRSKAWDIKGVDEEMSKILMVCLE